MSDRLLTVREIIRFATQILSALHHIHSKRLIHFDIKPDNVLLSDRMEGMLSDFGLAKYMEHDGHAEQDRVYGKMGPPDRYLGHEFSHLFDIYQAGLTIYRMCVGDESFYSQYNSFWDRGLLDRALFRHAVINGQFPDRNIFPEHIPQALVRTVRQCLEIDPGNRVSSAIDVVNQIASIDGNLLDWEYGVAANERKWLKEFDDRTICLTVDADSQSHAQQDFKTGASRRVVPFCMERITSRQIKEFLRNY